MSTSTTNYGFIKPDLGDPSGPEEIAENMIKAERALINIELGSSTGRSNKLMNCNFRNTNLAGIAINTDGHFTDPLTWGTPGGSSLWTRLYQLDENFSAPNLGSAWTFTSGGFEIYHAGYYRITWNLRFQMSATTMSEGFIRAALLGNDGYNPYTDDLAIVGSPIVVAMNTMTDITDIGTEQLIRVTQPERTTDGTSNTVTTGRNQRDYWTGSFYRYFIPGYAQNNPGSATATLLATESYCHIEFVRGL